MPPPISAMIAVVIGVAVALLTYDCLSPREELPEGFRSFLSVAAGLIVGVFDWWIFK